MKYRQSLLCSSVFLGLFALTLSAQAAGTVQLELVGDSQGAAMFYQEWSQALGKAGIRNVRILPVNEDAKPGIETQGTGANSVYVVTGIIRTRDELLLPGGKFRRTEIGKIAKWLKDLAERGPNPAKETKAPFDLTAEEFEKVHQDLATPVGFSTKDMTRQQAVKKIAGQLKLPIKLDADTAQKLGETKVEEELADLSSGTALACVLRPTGFALMPSPAGGELAYAVVWLKPDLKAWPVGLASDKPDVEAVPELFEPRNVNVENVSATQALEAIGQRVKVSVLIDRLALERSDIDPGKIKVSLPNKRTTYSQALRKLLYQAKLKFEVRYDEAEKPFLWVTTIRPGP
jgi:hypothetical protein